MLSRLDRLKRRGGGFNQFALNFISAQENAGVLLSNTQKANINNLVKALLEINKIDTNYFRPDNPSISKRKGIYPYIGATATSHKFNLVNPVDSDDAYRQVYGFVLHTEGKVTINATSNAFVKIPKLCNLLFSGYSNNIATFVDSTDITASYEVGVYVSASNQLRWRNDGTNLVSYNLAATSPITVPLSNIGGDYQGLIVMNSLANNNHSLWKNGVKIGQNLTTRAGTIPNVELTLSLAGVGSKSKPVIFHAFGEGLSDSVIMAETIAIMNFLQAEGRTFFFDIDYWEDNQGFVADENGIKLII